MHQDAGAVHASTNLCAQGSSKLLDRALDRKSWRGSECKRYANLPTELKVGRPEAVVKSLCEKEER